MKVKQIIKQSLPIVALAIGVVSVVAAPQIARADCGGVATSIVNCSQTGQGDGVENTGIWGILLLAINIMTAGVGVLAVAGIVWASIQYASAGGNSEQTKKAMTTITNIVIGILAFALMWAVLNFIVPGGVFR